MRLRFAVPAALALMGALPPLGMAASPEEAALRKMVADVQGAINQNDVARYESLLAEAIVAVEPDGEYRGRDALVDRFRHAPPGAQLTKSDVVFLRLTSPTTAVGLNRWEFVLPGVPPMTGRTVWAASKVKGAWVFDAWCVSPDPRPTDWPAARPR